MADDTPSAIAMSSIDPSKAPQPDPIPTPDSTASPSPLRRLSLGAPLRWLAAGLGDLRAVWPISLFFGVAFWAMAAAVRLVFLGQPEYTMTLVSGCFLLGPFLAMGLYEASRRREAGLPPDLGACLTCWDRRLGSMAMLVLVLLVLELLWGRASLVVFAVFFSTGMPSTASVVQAVFSPENYEFLAVYTVVGGAFAGLVFATCVISIPMILDRDTDAITAGLRSIQLTLTQPLVMLFWGVLIVALTLAAMALPWALGLVVVAPWLGHATWHAYRGAIDPALLPARPAPSPASPPSPP